MNQSNSITLERLPFLNVEIFHGFTGKIFIIAEMHKVPHTLKNVHCFIALHNKPGPAQVGAISKAQQAGIGPSRRLI